MGGEVRGRLSPWMRPLWSDNAPLVLLAAPYIASVELWAWRGGPPVLEVLWYSEVLTSTVTQTALFIVLIKALLTLAGVFRGTPLPQLWARFRDETLTPRVMVGFVTLLALMLPFFSAYTSYKRGLIWVRDLSWDQAFADADRVLHLGRHPWEWLHPVLAFPAITRALDVLYVLWFPLLVLVPIGMSISARRDLRLRFLLATGLTWGVWATLGAYAMPCGDPCYYQHLVPGDDPYAGLMRYLYDVNAVTPLAAIRNEEMLWATRVSPEWAPLGGVAGMPSLHVGYTVLLACLARAYGRGPMAVAVAYALCIGLGSVHLGWHYAVDGYASLLVVPALWWAAGRFVAWWEVEPSTFTVSEHAAQRTD